MRQNNHFKNSYFNGMTFLHNDMKNAVKAQGCVLAIGNFDGVHRGHRQLLEHARGIALRDKKPFAVMTFEPHPREFFQPASPPFRLSLLPMKQRLMSDIGVEHLFALPFNQDLAQLTGDAFIQDILVSGLGVHHVVVGEDFEFGRGRSGNTALLRAEKSFATTVMPMIHCAGHEAYSSTRIRAALDKADLKTVADLLGWPWEMEAPVVHGDKRGRTIGYPTANQRVDRYARLPFGIYAVRVMVEGETNWRSGAANFGIRPMFKVEHPILETFIFDFSEEIYDKNMRVRPVQRLRGEMNFDGIPSLQAQMEQDCLAAKAVLKSSTI